MIRSERPRAEGFRWSQLALVAVPPLLYVAYVAIIASVGLFSDNVMHGRWALYYAIFAVGLGLIGLAAFIGAGAVTFIAYRK